jgi:hypothetical protein
MPVLRLCFLGLVKSRDSFKSKDDTNSVLSPNSPSHILTAAVAKPSLKTLVALHSLKKDLFQSRFLRMRYAVPAKWKII